MPSYFQLEFLNANSQRAYPLSENSTQRDVTDSISIPDNFLVGMQLPVASAVETLPDNFYLRRLGVLGGAYTIEIAYDDGSSDHPIVASTSLASAGFTEYSTYALVGVNSWDDTVGRIVIGQLSGVAALPAGIYEFDPSGAALDPDVIRPLIRGVSSLATEQGGLRSSKLRNHVVLQAGRNIRLSVIEVTGQDPVIRIDAIADTDLEPCLCVEQSAPCIRTINDIPGDAQQNFTLQGDNCLKLTPITNGLQLTDECCQPCCGCAELEAVLAALRGVQSTARTLENFATRLATEQTQLRVAATLLSDCGCPGTSEAA